ncbi:hypothetical protein [Prochlorococcus sp. MIT 1300]|uniref:hypothetical protein n=1 Tax=Prochlorococcus sp. MIT 1300 TaxID=3096218 RepID=UPI002A763221|nr:hypothetical protein [Prochlorococcus sp. MIT 1300]
MRQKSPVAIFMAASALLAGCAGEPKLQPEQQQSNAGGTKEWTTDQEVNDKSTLDEDAKKAAKKAKEQDICIPIGEGENCW